MINNSNNILYQDSVPMFTTILDLRAYANYEQGDIVEVGGRTSIGDGYGSRFIYDSTSTVADDGEYTIRPDNIAANGSGRWLINGWAYLDDKMNANNKNLTGMTITRSTLDGSKITNSTLNNVTVPSTTNWTSNTVVGALDIDTRYETKGSVANDINTAVSSSLAESKAYTDNGLALKANLADGNTFTGNQVINGGLSVTNSSGTVYGNTAGSSKWYISRNDSQKCTMINSYNGSWHYLAIEDDGTITCNNGTLALQSAVDAKANLAGGNALTGEQAISSGSLKVIGSDNSYASIIKDAESTEKGAIVRYNDGSTNHDWVLGSSTITAPDGSTISTSGNYAVKDQDNHFSVDQTMKSIVISGGSNITFNNSSGSNAILYADATGNDGGLNLRTGLSGSYHTTIFEPNGLIASNTFGNVVMENRSNTLQGTQKINVDSCVLGFGYQNAPVSGCVWGWNWINGDGKTHWRNYHGGGPGGFMWWNGATNGSDQVMVMNLNPDGALSTAKGTVAFTSQLPTSGTIANGTYTKIGNVLRQTFRVVTPASDGTATISFPITYSQIPNVILTGGMEETTNIPVTASIQRNSAGTALATTTSNVPIRIWWDGGTSSQQSIITLTVEGIA